MSLTLKGRELQEIVYNDNKDWEEIKTNIEDQGRWSIGYSGIFKHIPTNKHYRIYWSIGSTEQQDESPFEYELDDDILICEVGLKKVTVEQWVVVD